jgi:hypothetical protein
MQASPSMHPLAHHQCTPWSPTVTPRLSCIQALAYTALAQQSGKRQHIASVSGQGIKVSCFVACIDDISDDSLVEEVCRGMDLSCKIPGGRGRSMPQLVVGTLDINQGALWPCTRVLQVTLHSTPPLLPLYCMADTCYLTLSTWWHALLQGPRGSLCSPCIRFQSASEHQRSHGYGGYHQG